MDRCRSPYLIPALNLEPGALSQFDIEVFTMMASGLAPTASHISTTACHLTPINARLARITVPSRTHRRRHAVDVTRCQASTETNGQTAWNFKAKRPHWVEMWTSLRQQVEECTPTPSHVHVLAITSYCTGRLFSCRGKIPKSANLFILNDCCNDARELIAGGVPPPPPPPATTNTRSHTRTH